MFGWKKRQTKWNVWVIKDKQDGFQNSPASQKEAHQRQSAQRPVSESFYQFNNFVFSFELLGNVQWASSTVFGNLSQPGARVKWLQLRGGGEIEPLSLFCLFLVVFSSAGPAFTFFPDKPARLIFRLLFGFDSESLFVKLNQSIFIYAIFFLSFKGMVPVIVDYQIWPGEVLRPE